VEPTYLSTPLSSRRIFTLDAPNRRAAVSAITSSDRSAVAGELASSVHRRLALRPRVEPVAAGSLPRYELKARRFKLA